MWSSVSGASMEGNESTGEDINNPVPTNSDVFKIVNNLKSKKEFGVQQLNSSFKDNFPHIHITAAPVTLYNKAHSVYKKVIRFQQNKQKSQSENFLMLDFALPKQESNLDRATTSAKTERERKLVHELSVEKGKTKSLKRTIAKLEKENEELVTSVTQLEGEYSATLSQMQTINEELSQMNKTLKQNQGASYDLLKSYKSLKSEYEQHQQKLDKVQAKLIECKKNSTRNLKKKIKYRDDKLAENSKEMNELKAKQAELQSRLTEALQQLNVKTKLLDSTEMKVEKLKTAKRQLQYKVGNLKRNLGNKATSEIDSSHLEELESLQKKIAILDQENRELQRLVHLLQDEVIVTFEGGRYCDEIREVIMELLTMNVSMNKVNDVIRLVLKKLAGKVIDRLPGLDAKSRFLVEARNLAHSQVAEAMLERKEQSGTGNCLHGDGTTKYHRHLQSFQVTTSSGNTLSFGLQEMAGQDAGTLMKTFTSAVDELTEVVSSNDSDKERVFAELVTSIRSTMSDQCAVNPCFNEQLNQSREKLLPACVENWENLSEKEQDELKEMCNFFCKLHLLANFATETDKILKLFENIAFDVAPKPIHVFATSESGAVRLLRTVCKAFHPRGSDESGVADYFISYLHDQGKTLHLLSYVGNRLNIQFYNGGAVYFHADDIKLFLKDWPSPNNLLQAVSEDIQVKVHLAEVRALGIIDKLVTGPFWRVVNDAQNILSLNSSLLQIKRSFQRWTEDASPLLEGTPLFDEEDVPVHRDETYEKLFAPTNDPEFESLTQQALEMLMYGLLLILERPAQDQLPGGKYFDPSQSVSKIASTVPSTNMALERDFAILDLLIRSKSHATTLAYEAYIMWQNNGTLSWLDSKSQEEKSVLLEQARKCAPQAKARYKERQEILKRQKLEKLKEKPSSKEKAEQKAQKQKLKAVEDLIKVGRAWIQVDEVDTELEKLESDSEKREVILAQLNFHKHVLQSKAKRYLFQQSQTKDHKKIIFDLPTLVSNLKEVIQQCALSQPQMPATSGLVKEHTSRQMKVCLEKKLLQNKVKESRNKILVKQQKEMLPKFLEDPALLVGQKVNHRVIEDDSDDVFWCEGTVLELCKLNKKTPSKSEFLIHYDIEEEDVSYRFPLLQDMKKGDLIILE